MKEIITFTRFYKVSPDILASQGAIDPILNFDSKYFIDPLLLRTSSSEEFHIGATRQLDHWLSKVFRLLAASKRVGDPAWRGAASLLSGREVAGISLGYGGTRTTGSNLDRQIAQEMLLAVREFIDLGYHDPDLFLAMPLLIERVGADTISDIVAGAILPSIALYTQRVLNGCPDEMMQSIEIQGAPYRLPQHPFQAAGSPLHLVPQDIVAKLPITSDWSQLSEACQVNEHVRESFKSVAAKVFTDLIKSDSARKQCAREEIRSNTGFVCGLRDTIKALKELGIELGGVPDEVLLARLAGMDDSEIVTAKSPRDFSDPNSIASLVEEIIGEFKHLVEDKRFYALFYNNAGAIVREDTVQKVFHIVALAHCRAWNLDVTPEAETGNGPVDFKVSHGMQSKCIVELKLSTNGRAVHGYAQQTEEYARGERTQNAFFVLVDVGRIGKKWEKIEGLSKRSRVKAYYVDAKRRDSASVA